MTEIRLLKSNEIECRVGSISDTGKKGPWLSLLLYKDARCDMKILDETFGILGWQREHQIVNGMLCCTISIYDESCLTWVKKQDVGTESYTEKEKGVFSDSFKRANVNIGIGRELYTAPFIFINLEDGEIEHKNNKVQLSRRVKFRVAKIDYNEDREIEKMIIKDNKGVTRYRIGYPQGEQ